MSEGLAFRNPVKQQGWAQVYHVLTLDRDLSDGAFRLYVLLLRYARQAEGCWPGRERLAQDLGRSKPTIERRLSELVDRSLITREQRGHGRTAMTYIEDVEAIYSPIKNDEASPIKNDEALAPSKMRTKEHAEEEADMNGGVSPTEHTESLSLLVGFGVSPSVARYLARDADLETVRGWISCAKNAKGLHNPAAFVVSKLKAGDPVPTNGRKPENDRKRYLDWLQGGDKHDPE